MFPSPLEVTGVSYSLMETTLYFGYVKFPSPLEVTGVSYPWVLE